MMLAWIDRILSTASFSLLDLAVFSAFGDDGGDFSCGLRCSLEHFAAIHAVLFLFQLFQFLPGAVQIFEHFGKAGIGDVKNGLAHGHPFFRLVPQNRG